MFYTLSALLAVIVYLALTFAKRTKRHPPGPPGIPIIGETLRAVSETR